MGEFLGFISDKLFKKKTEVPERKDAGTDSRFYDYLVGVWPEMMHAIVQDMDKQGASKSEQVQAQKLMMENRDRIFLESIKEFEQSGETDKDKNGWVKGEERIAYKKFMLLLKESELKEKRAGLLRSYLDGPQKRGTDYTVTPEATEEDLASLRGIVSPERFMELTQKKDLESAIIATLPDQEETAPEEPRKAA